MPLDHRCFVIGSNIVLSDNIFHVIGSDFMPLNRTSCHWIKLHAIESNFMPLDRTSCHWIGLHVIGSNFMPLNRTSCHWIELHAIESNFMPLNRTSCHWIELHAIGPAAYRINLFPRVLFQIHNGKYGGSSSGSTSNSTRTYRKQRKNGTSWCYESTGFQCRSWLWLV